MSQKTTWVTVGVAIVAALIWTVSADPVSADDPPETKTAVESGDEGETVVEDEALARRQEAITVFNEGVTALEAKEMPAALESFLKASQIDPDFTEAHIAAAAVAMEVKDFQAAADAAEGILRLQPDNVDAMGTAYFAELMVGDIERLIPSARRLADANPELVSNEMLQHAQVLFDDNELAGSKALLELIVERQPELAPAHFQLGLTCNMLGEVACAKEALAKYIELAPDDPDAATAQSLLDYL